MTLSSVPVDKILDLYTRILRIRRFEEQVGKLFAQGQLPGLVHLYIGEEAVGGVRPFTQSPRHLVTFEGRVTFAA